MSVYVAGSFASKDEATQAIQRLKENGYSADDLTVFSSEPVEFARGVLDRPSRMSFAAVAGAAFFLISIVSFVYYTQNAYKIPTGGMPIFSFWPTAVVFYEITMLGAVLTITFWFLKESGLLRRDKSAPVPAIDPDLVSLRVRSSDEGVAQASAFLAQAGAKSVAKLEKSA